jgi:UDP-N-acetylglucosamine diphosphorylase/glucosamine-1-phosphate N-acetyltransferase
MNIILFDDPAVRNELLPLTYTRPVAAIRVGILTIAEKWKNWLGLDYYYQTEEYLQKKFQPAKSTQNLLINGAICPDSDLVDAIKALPAGYFLIQQNTLIAANNPQSEITEHNTISYQKEVVIINKLWKIFGENAAQIKSDFKRITSGRKSAPITDPFTQVYAPENIFLEPGAVVRASILNAENGPIYLGKNSVVNEGSIIRGSFSLGEESQVNMGAKLRGDTTVGPYSKIGGEVSNSVIFGFSNKGHDGFLGNSVIGEWCNLGADTNTSNLKNNYDLIKLWNHASQRFEPTGLQFCGVILGDHSKCGINTMFNTGTVVDVCSCVFGEGYPPNFIPSFAWGGAKGFVTHQFEKAIATEQRVLGRRSINLTSIDQEILKTIYNSTGHYRKWEK